MDLLRFALFPVLILCHGFACADLIISAPPRENVEQGKAQYEPIANFLSKQLGRKVGYVHPSSWEEYALNMREDKYDIVFDGPHFSAWRMKHLNHFPVVKLPGDLMFYVVAAADNKKVRRMRQLTSHKTCGMASPNLSMLNFLAQFAQSAAMPPVVEIKGGAPDVYRAFKDGKCEAAIVSDDFYLQQLPKQEREQLKIIYTSEKMPNQTITVSSRVDKRERDLITHSLLTPQGSKSAIAVLNRFSREKPVFIATSSKDYSGVENLLEGVVWGW